MIDFGTLFFQLFSNLWWLPPLLVIAALLRAAWFKGVIGEALVSLAVRLFPNKNDYRLIRHVTIPTEDGSTRKSEAFNITSGQSH